MCSRGSLKGARGLIVSRRDALRRPSRASAILDRTSMTGPLRWRILDEQWTHYSSGQRRDALHAGARLSDNDNRAIER